MSQEAAAVDTQNAAAAEPVAQPAAPQTQAAPAAQPAAEPAAVQAGEYTYESTGYANADYALGVIGKAGIGPEHPAVKAAYDGDFAQLEYLLASKEVPGANSLLSMLKDAAAQHEAEQAATGERIMQEVHELAGSKEQWDAVQAWASENAEDDEKEVLNDLFKNDRTHKIAATYLMAMYDKAQVPHEPQADVQGGRPAVASRQAPAGPLNRAQFAAEAQKLYKQFGNDYTSRPEYAALGQRLKN